MNRRSPRGEWPLVAFGIPIFLLSACSGDGASVPEPVSAAVLTLGASAPELADAVAMAERDCVRAAGLDMPLFLPPTGAYNSSLPRALGLRSVESARERGYDLPDTTTGLSPAEIWFSGLSEADQLAFEEATSPDGSREATVVSESNGFSMSASLDGCTAKARSIVYGSVENFLEFQVWDNSVAGQGNDWTDDGQLHDVLERYADCMRGAGYNVSTVQEAATQAEQRFGEARSLGGPVTSEESAMAVADATCQDQEEVTDEVNAAFLRSNAQFFIDNEAKVMELAELRTESLERAKAIIRGA